MTCTRSLWHIRDPEAFTGSVSMLNVHKSLTYLYLAIDLEYWPNFSFLNRGAYYAKSQLQAKITTSFFWWIYCCSLTMMSCPRWRPLPSVVHRWRLSQRAGSRETRHASKLGRDVCTRRYGRMYCGKWKCPRFVSFVKHGTEREREAHTLTYTHWFSRYLDILIENI